MSFLLSSELSPAWWDIWLWRGIQPAGTPTATYKSPLWLQHGTLTVFQPHSSPGVLQFGGELESQIKSLSKKKKKRIAWIPPQADWIKVSGGWPPGPLLFSDGPVDWDTHHNGRTTAVATRTCLQCQNSDDLLPSIWCPLTEALHCCPDFLSPQ